MSKLKPKLFTTMKGYSKEQFFRDVTAGVIVSVIALPLSIALAIASGVLPEKGLHTAIIAGFLISLFGGSRVQIGGPTGAFMIVVYGIVTQYGLDGLVIATFMAGIIMIMMGLFKLGSIIKFIPYPITTGFTSGIAVVIFSSQIKDFFGLKLEDVPPAFIDKWRLYFDSFRTFDFETTIIGLTALMIIVLWPKVTRRVPGALISLVATAAIVNIFDLQVATIGSKFGELSPSLPDFVLPKLDLDKVAALILPAFTIAILGSIESLLSAVVSDGMIGGKHRSNMELVAQGIANIGSSLFGGIPATGAIARTVANIKNGGKTPIAGMVHAVMLLLIMVLFMPLAKMIPLASLAAVLIIVAYNMSEWRAFRELFKSPKSDILVLLVVFFVTVLVDLVKAIEIGVVLASLLFMKRMADISDVHVVPLDASEHEPEDFDVKYKEERKRIHTPKNVQIYEINGPFFFGAADKFVKATGHLGHKTHKLIIRMRNVPFMDATALHAFKIMIESCRRKKVRVMLSEVNNQTITILKTSGIHDLISSKYIFNTVDDAIEYAVYSEQSR